MPSTHAPVPAVPSGAAAGAPSGAPPDGAGPELARPAAVLVIFLLGLFMTLLDVTIVNVAIPTMATGLGSSLDQVLWVLNAYSIAYAVLLITAGRLGDVVGPRTMFMIGMTVFTLASAGSGAAPTVGWLIACRALQGLGAAVLAPQGLPLFTSVLPPERRAGAFAAMGAMSGLAVLAGPTLGGLIVTHWGWRWIFYVNVPLGVLTVALAWRLLPDLRPGRRHRLDGSGVVLLTAGLFAVVFGLIEGERYDWGVVSHSVTIWEIVAAGVLVLAVFWWRQARTQRGEPLLPFEVFHDRNFTLMTLVLGGMGFAMVGLYLPLTIYLQSVLGLSAVAAGLAMAPQPLAMMVSSAVAGALGEKVGGKLLLVPGLVVFVAGTAWVVTVAGPGTSRWALAPGLAVAGLGLGCVWVPIFGLATRDLQPRLAGVGAGVLDTVQEIGSVVATAVIGAVLQTRLAQALVAEASARAAALPQAARAGFVSGFRTPAGGGLDIGSGAGPGAATGAAGTDGGAGGMAGAGADLARQLARLGQEVFRHAYVTAMRPTMLVPLLVLLAAALVGCAVRRHPADQ
jgi:EmrB/QacA subfamily drug resistance transporter